MKIFQFFTIAAANARRDESNRSEFSDCGGLTELSMDMNSVEIFSPVNHTMSDDSSIFYPSNTFCEWNIQDKCAESFRIDTTYFDIEEHHRCDWDSLTITNGDSTYNSTFCNRFKNLDNDYWGEPESWAEFEDLVPGEPTMINHRGFHLSVTSVQDDSVCSPTIDDTPSIQMIDSFTKLRDILDNTMAEAITRKPEQKMKQFRRVAERFSWFYEHTFDSCENSTNAPFGTKKWTIPEIGADICGSFISLMDSAMEFYDHKVCLDRIHLKENRRAKRRNEKIADDFRRSKKVFNRLLKALDCPQRLDVN
ncbi:Oidioi.mRNA.OKI2018_I69.PAR.g9612.t1.cds [Oikopleura dioica]|uniref:Oidioi.mRNA.OKI2018_I69.PAR.g9612.t1.cds n=1 Tax=Oikopleura dioica TaxID=34765 RepID=A0ABN7RLF2_OIKDI|nr:Oidioi.mRNA.OKI2018_I69.PAR.g9612.t1.cds [Oikopleura dioica]